MSLSNYEKRHREIFGTKKVQKGRYYIFDLTDGSKKSMTLSEAVKSKDSLVRKRLKTIILNSKNKKMKKDGFQPGWQENINAYAGGRREYDQMLKDRGLIEIGNDYIPQESEGNLNPCGTDEFINTARSIGVEINSSEEAAMKDGSYFEES